VVKKVLDTTNRCYSYSTRQASATKACTLCRKTTTVGFLLSQLYLFTVSSRKAIPARLEREECVLPLFPHDKDLADIWPQNSRCGLPSAKDRCLITFWTCWVYSPPRELTSLNTASGGGNITHTRTAVI